MKNELFGICPFVTAQKLLQGKWAILILHALNEGTKRFNELERDIQITHATLSSQLKYMERKDWCTAPCIPRCRHGWSTPLPPWADDLHRYLTASRYGARSI